MKQQQHAPPITKCNKISNFLDNKKTLELINSNLKGWSLSKLICTTLLLGVFQSIFPHGTVTSPASRVWNCYQDSSSAACRAAIASHGQQPFYDWNEVNQANANGQHMNYVLNGYLASGGRPKYGGLDQVRTDWVATSVSPGPFTVTWTNSAPHATAYYSVYITKASWTPDQPLTWESLELLVQTAPSAGAYKEDIPVTLPQRTGKHVIYSIWQRADSPEAFYSTSDVDFGKGVLSINDFERTSATLKQNFPNPFSTTSNINYTIKKEGNVSLKVYNILGEEVSTLIDSYQNLGEYEVVFDRKNLSDGLYFYVFKLGDYIETKKMVLQK